MPPVVLLPIPLPTRPSRAVVGKDTILALGVDGHQMRYVATKRTWKCCSPQLAPCASIVKTTQVKASEEPVIPWYKLGVIFKIRMDFQLVNCPLHFVDLLTNWRIVFCQRSRMSKLPKGLNNEQSQPFFCWKHPLDSVDVEDFHSFPCKNHLGQFSPQAACKRSIVAIVIHMFWRRSFRAQQDSLGFPNETSRAAGSAKHLALHSVGLLKYSSKYARVQWTLVYLLKTCFYT